MGHEIMQTISGAGESLGLIGEIVLVPLLRLAADPVGVNVAHQTGGNTRMIS